MALSQEEKEVYADVINTLFGGAVTATVDNVTEQAAVYADTMISEITKCSNELSQRGFEIIYGLIPVKGIIVRIGKALAKELFKDWVQKLTTKQHAACINTARANWRSRMEIELLGI